MTDIDRITTLPDMAAVKSGSIKLPVPKDSQVYIPVIVTVEKQSESVFFLIVTFIIILCTIINIGTLFLNQVIVIR